MKETTARVAAVVAMAVAVVGFGMIHYGEDLRGDASANKLSASSLAVSALRDLDRIALLAARAKTEVVEKALMSAALEAFEPAAKTGLDDALACWRSPDCHPRFEAKLEVVKEAHKARLDRYWQKAEEESATGETLMISGLLLTFATTLFLAVIVIRSRQVSTDNKPESSAKMEELLRDRLTQLYAARQEASESEHFAAYGEIAAGLSHGLKTPLASVRAACQVAQRKLEPDHPATEYLDEIISEVDGLVEQVRRFLQAAGPGSKSVGQRVAPQVLLQAIDDAFRSEAKSRGVTWETKEEGELGEIEVDPAMLDIAFRNLVENSLAVAPAQSTVRVLLRSCAAPDRVGVDQAEPPDGKNWLEIAISDEGPGMPSQIVDGSGGLSTKPQGSGLGMAIARRIVARQGGALVIETKEAEGTTVRVVLPESGRGGAERAATVPEVSS